MTRSAPAAPALALAALLTAVSASHAQSYRTVWESRSVNGERDLVVDVEFAVGRFQLQPASGRQLYRVSMVYDEDQFRPDVRYRESRGRLDAGLESVHDINVGRRDLSDQRLDLAISPDVALDLQLQFGAAEADLELGGLSLVDGLIKTGASETVVRFSEPNRARCGTLRFEVGAASFEARNLANARCREIEVAAGVAEVVLDFTGAWVDDIQTSVQIRMGLGEVRLRLPENLGVRLHVDRFLVGVDHAGFDKRGSTYTSRNWDQVSHHLDIEIDAALGSIEVDWLPTRGND